MLLKGPLFDGPLSDTQTLLFHDGRYFVRSHSMEADSRAERKSGANYVNLGAKSCPTVPPEPKLEIIICKPKSAQLIASEMAYNYNLK